MSVASVTTIPDPIIPVVEVAARTLQEGESVTVAALVDLEADTHRRVGVVQAVMIAVDATERPYADKVGGYVEAEG